MISHIRSASASASVSVRRLTALCIVAASAVGVTSGVAQAAEQARPAPAAQAVAAKSSGDLDRWIAQARDVLTKHGDKVPSAAAIHARALTESSGDPRAENHWDGNESRYGGTYGLLQMIRPTFAQWCVPGHKDILNPVDSIVAGVRYANDRYGSFEKIAYTKAGY